MAGQLIVRVEPIDRDAFLTAMQKAGLGTPIEMVGRQLRYQIVAGDGSLILGDHDMELARDVIGIFQRMRGPGSVTVLGDNES